MSLILTDPEIDALVREPKPLPANYRQRLALVIDNRHKRANLEVRGGEGHQFRIMLRQAELNALDFSVILAVEPPGYSKPFLLRRFNGKSHEHKNTLER
ncbi:MAG: hypothetical protein WKG32_19910 [Gemmatimonadaceae bacterium]